MANGMRILVIGDIHGCFRSLNTVIEAAGAGRDDVIITLGDYVDRGPNSAEVVDWVMRGALSGSVIPIRGNHELMMLSARQDGSAFHDWLGWGGDTTLCSYSGQDVGFLEDVPAEHWEFLEMGCRRFFETETHFFVHASADPNLPLDRQSDYTLFWEKFYDPPPHRSGKIMICGHTAQKSGMPHDIGHAICIDTYAYGGGWLTCLEPETGHYWQANEHGETRSARLEGPTKQRR
jgi:serine/threonine protein phosphatase 1